MINKKKLKWLCMGLGTIALVATIIPIVVSCSCSSNDAPGNPVVPPPNNDKPIPPTDDNGSTFNPYLDISNKDIVMKYYDPTTFTLTLPPGTIEVYSTNEQIIVIKNIIFNEELESIEGGCFQAIVKSPEKWENSYIKSISYKKTSDGTIVQNSFPPNLINIGNGNMMTNQSIYIWNLAALHFPNTLKKLGTDCLDPTAAFDFTNTQVYGSYDLINCYKNAKFKE